jgi:hypothetical protein
MEEIRVQNAVGKHKFTADVSKTVAVERAKEKAKLDAMNKAGTGEDIIASATLISNESAKGKYKDFFSSFIKSHQRGGLKNLNFSKPKYHFVDNEKSIEEVTIELECTVLKYKTVTDASFTVQIDKLKSNYNDGDKLAFNISLTQDAYLWAFLINGNRGYRLFPNEYEKSTNLKAGDEYSFPMNKKLKYTLELNKEDKVEGHLLVFVFLKNDKVKFNLGQNNISPLSILEWYSMIPPDQKLIEYREFQVIE